MSDGDRFETITFQGEEIRVLMVECADCGQEYPLGGDVNGPDPEGAEHHAPDCPVRRAKVNRGIWVEPDEE